MDFGAIKRIRLVEVLGRYGVSLKYRGDWASAPCPLPSHKKGDKNRTFSVNLKENYWRCFSESCNANCGGKKGGDVINFVALMEGCTMKQAAEKLAEKKAEHIARPTERVEEKPTLKAHPDSNPSAGKRNGFMHDANLWLDEFLRRGEQESEEDYLARLRKGFMTQLARSYRNGQKVQAGLPVEPFVAAPA